MSGCGNTSSSLAPTCGCYRNAPFPGSREGGCGCVSQLLCALDVEGLPWVGAQIYTVHTTEDPVNCQHFPFQCGFLSLPRCFMSSRGFPNGNQQQRTPGPQQAAGRSTTAPGLFFSSLRSAPSHFKQLCRSVDCRLMIRAGEPVLPPRQAAFHQMSLTPESCCCWVHPSLPTLPGLASDLEQVSGAASGRASPLLGHTSALSTSPRRHSPAHPLVHQEIHKHLPHGLGWFQLPWGLIRLPRGHSQLPGEHVE